MKKYKGLNLLVLSDEDMNCSTKSGTLEKMSISDIGLSMFAIQDYEMVIYEGAKGSKILKSSYTKKGIIS